MTQYLYLLGLLLFSFAAGKSAEKDSIELVFAGDAMMHQRQLDAARKGNGYDFSGYYDALKPYISSADYAVVNLELPLGGSNYSGYPQFCAPDSYLDPLVDAGFDLFLNANNHILDRSDAGLRRTLTVLDERGLPHVGAYQDKAQRDTVTPMIKNIGGFDIAFLNYTYGTNGIVARKGAVVDYINKDLIASDIKKAREKGAELICVCIHWGDEYVLLPVQSEKTMADFLTEQGVDLIIGGHPHVIQPMEIRHSAKHNKDVFLCYSLGNFISAMRKTDTRGGAMARVKISRDSDGKPRIEDASYRMVFTLAPGGGSTNYRLVPAETPTGGYMEAERKAFVGSASRIFNKHNVRVPLDTIPVASY